MMLCSYHMACSSIRIASWNNPWKSECSAQVMKWNGDMRSAPVLLALPSIFCSTHIIAVSMRWKFILWAFLNPWVCVCIRVIVLCPWISIFSIPTSACPQLLSPVSPAAAAAVRARWKGAREGQASDGQLHYCVGARGAWSRATLIEAQIQGTEYIIRKADERRERHHNIVFLSTWCTEPSFKKLNRI